MPATLCQPPARATLDELAKALGSDGVTEFDTAEIIRGADYGLRVNGDGWRELGLRDGDVIGVAKTRPPPGELAVACDDAGNVVIGTWPVKCEKVYGVVVGMVRRSASVEVARWSRKGKRRGR